MIRSNDLILAAAVIGGAALLYKKGKLGSYVGESIGSAITRIPTGIIKGAAGATKDYIDVANEAGKSSPLHLSNLSWSVWDVGQKFKKLGSDERWFW